jgi:hypothetical protein
MTEAQVKPSPTDDEISVLSWPECARLCKSESPRPDAAIAFVWGQNDHVLRRFIETTALPNLRRLRIESPTWERGPGELFLGLAARGTAARGDDRHHITRPCQNPPRNLQGAVRRWWQPD